ncbi:MAG: T9SS type A sorting domain-containing protein, partial [Clostridia bacterium]|nr:T9SS type A sorting domain-containing protein [Clostridia bacterium]
ELDWSFIAGNTGYIYQIDTLPSFDSPLLFENTTAINSSGAYVYDLYFGTTYYWRAAAKNAVDTSEWSATWSFTTTHSMYNTSPSNQVTNQPVLVELDWSSINGNTGYIYQIDTLPSFDSPLLFENTTAINSSSAYVYDLYFGTTYYWRAAAKNAVDTSDWSATWSFTTTNSMYNTSPSNQATNQPVLVELDWSGINGNTGYIYQIDTLPSFDSPVLDEGTSPIDASYKYVGNLFYGTTYYWRAAAKNTVDTSDWSPTWSFTTIDVLLNYSPTNGAVNISINPAIDWGNLSGSTGYVVGLDTSQTFSSSLYQEQSVSNSQSNYTNLLYGTTYYWHAAGLNAVDTSSWSVTWSFTTAYELTDAPILISPTNSITGLSYSEVDFTWSASPEAINYQYQVSLNSEFTAIIKSTTTSLISGNIIGLYPHTTYYWRVRGANTNGYSPWSETWSFTTESADLIAPTLITPANNSTNINIDNVILDWESVFGASAYIFEITEDENFISGVTTQQINDTQKEIIGLSEGTQYFWRVKSTDGIVYSDWSEIWNFTTEISALDAPILVTPLNNATGISVESAILDWNSVIGASQYVYEISTDMNFNNNVSTEIINETQKEIFTLSTGTQYFWRVKAINSTLESNWSETWNFITEVPQQYLLTINIVGCGTVNVDGVEYTEPIMIVENSIVTLTAETTESCHFTNWDGDLVGSTNPQQLQMNANKTVTAIFDIVQVDQVANNQQIQVYPNPATEYITINADNINKVEIINITGQTVFTLDQEFEYNNILIKHFNKGLYFIKITTDNGVYIENLVIQ